MLHFASNGGFAAFNISSPVNGLVAYLGELAGAEVNAVADRKGGLIGYDGYGKESDDMAVR